MLVWKAQLHQMVHIHHVEPMIVRVTGIELQLENIYVHYKQV